MRKFALIAASSAALVLSSGYALAVSGGSSSGSSGSANTCKQGYVWDKKTKKCVQQSGSNIPDDELIQQGWALAKSGQFEAGRALFSAVANRNNPEVYNGLGYTNRKLGYFTDAIAFYQKALALDPNYVQAREYLGEGYVTMGKFDLASDQLAQIGRICGATCEEYTDLREFIDTAVRQAVR